MSLIADLAGSAMRLLDPEQAHRLAISGLKTGLVPGCRVADDPALGVRLWDLDFPNPVGLAAGFDKNAEVPDALLKLGFGFVEVGSVTPKPQAGNPRPRLFRLSGDQAVINRMGFNNDGLAQVAERLRTRTSAGLVGVNVGANKDSQDRIGDYETGIAVCARFASYLTINVSSPNTPGLRDLQSRAALRELLERCCEARDVTTVDIGRKVPLVLKIAPDIDNQQMNEIAEEVLAAKIEGLMVSNTTLDRTELTDTKQANEAGGMSGRPLFRRSTIALAKMRQRVGPELPIIGVGGIESAETAWTKITAGATLIQIYTGMIFQGPGLAARIVGGLAEKVRANNMQSITDAVGVNQDAWAQSEI